MDSHIHTFPQGRDNQRRVSVHGDIFDDLTNKSYARSLLHFCVRWCNDQVLSFTMSYKLLNVLDALTIRFDEFPIEIIEIVHLRYLAFLYIGKRMFPVSIYKLQNLQTLIVYQGYIASLDRKLYLPLNIWKMPKLRHLMIDRGVLPYPLMHTDSVNLENLQTLSEVTNFKCSKEVLKLIRNVKRLGVTYFHDDRTVWSSYELDSIVYLQHLETLKLIFTEKGARTFKPLPINHLAFPQSLKKLTLSGCAISWEKMTIAVGSLHNLEVLKLKDYAVVGSVWEPKEGEFRQLKYLLIANTDLKQWRGNHTHFPQLQHLCLGHCSSLEAIPCEIGDIQTLELVELYECSRSAVASAMRIQEEQQNLENDGLRVRITSARDIFDSCFRNSLRKAQKTYKRTARKNT